MKKKILIIIAGFLAVCICFGQNSYRERIVKRIENKPFVIEGDSKYEIDQTRIIAKLKPQRSLPITLCAKSQDLGFDIIEIPVPTDIMVEDYLSLLERTGDFEFVDFNTYGEYFFTPNDSLIGNQTGHQWYLDRINAYNAWNITKGYPFVKVAVFDCGIDSCHYDIHYGLDNYTHLDILNGYNYPNNINYSVPGFYHGTMVAGIIGAKTNNSRGIAGISGGNQSAGIAILPMTVGYSGPITNYVISAISRAVEKGVKIINMSFGLSYNEGVSSAINSAYNNGITIVCATGNENHSYLSFPASHANTIAVGASNQSNERWQIPNSNGSNYGNGLDLVAPGVDIMSTSLNNSYQSGTGTSFSAPQVVGVVALMLSVNPTLTPNQIRNTLRSTCTNLSNYSYTNGWNSEVGYGLLNAYAAVNAVAAHNIIGPTLIASSGTYNIDNLPSGSTVEWAISDSYYNDYHYFVPNYSGQGTCRIIRNNSHDLMNGTLTAKIKYNGVIIRTLTKSNLYAYAGFWGQYTSGGLSGNINSSGYFNIKKNSFTTITSPNFYGATVSYSSSGATPSSWSFNSSTGVLSFYVSNITIPVILNVHDGCGNDYVLYAYPSSSYSINVSNGESGITVTLVEDGDVSKDFTPDEPWTIEIINTESGRVMTTLSSTNRSETISTAGWPKGIYIVKVTIGKEELTEKVMVK